MIKFSRVRYFAVLTILIAIIALVAGLIGHALPLDNRARLSEPEINNSVADFLLKQYKVPELTAVSLSSAGLDTFKVTCKGFNTAHEEYVIAEYRTPRIERSWNDISPVQLCDPLKKEKQKYGRLGNGNDFFESASLSDLKTVNRFRAELIPTTDHIAFMESANGSEEMFFVCHQDKTLSMYVPDQKKRSKIHDFHKPFYGSDLDEDIEGRWTYADIYHLVEKSCQTSQDEAA